MSPGIKQIQAPPSKSVSHRTLICAGLADGVSLIRNPLRSQDLERTSDCLTQLGARISGLDTKVDIQGTGQPRCASDSCVRALDVGESGTTCRLITAVSAAFPGASRISGRGRMHQRPIQDLTNALILLGASFEFHEQPGYPPFTVRSEGLKAGSTFVSMEESSQFLSGLLLAAPLAQGDVTIEVTGKKIVSWPYVGITLQVMEDFGVTPNIALLHKKNWTPVHYKNVEEVRPGAIKFQFTPAGYRPREYEVEGDWSNSSYFLAASALMKTPVAVTGLRKDSLQGDKAILDILSQMGATITWEGDQIIVQGGELRGIDVDMGHCPDLVPTVAAVAAQIPGKTRIRNVAHLRIKESDRLEAVHTELSRIGCKTQLFEDGLEICSGDLSDKRKVEFTTYGDHRMAMSLSLFELAGFTVILDNPDCVAKSFPEFWTEWEKIRTVNLGNLTDALKKIRDTHD